jgi:hypothetical protein
MQLTGSILRNLISYYILYLVCLCYGLVKIPLHFIENRKIENKIRNNLVASYCLERKVERCKEKLLAFQSIIDDSKLKITDQQMRNHIYALEDVYNQTQVFDVSMARHSHLLPDKYTNLRTENEKRFLVELMEDLKYECFEYQFLLAQFFSSIVEYFYLCDVIEATDNEAQTILNDYNRFKKRSLIATIFPRQSSLKRRLLF